MNIAIRAQAETRMAIVAIIEPGDTQRLEQLCSILPPGAFVRIPLSVQDGGQMDLAAKIPDTFPQFIARQAAIVGQLKQDMSNKQIGRALAISHFTVRNHISQILRLLHVASRHDAIVVLKQMDIMRCHHAAMEHRPDFDATSTRPETKAGPF